LAEAPQKPDVRSPGLVEGLRDIQGQYMMLADLFEKEKSYAYRLTDIVRTLQREADEVIPLRPEAIGENCEAAYLVSEAVVVMFDSHRHMTSKPFSALPASAIVSAIEDSASALGKLIAEKRKAEMERVESLERALKELKKAQATFKVAKGEEARAGRAAGGSEDKGQQQKEESGKETQEPQPEYPTEVPSKDAFTFKGVFGDKREREGLT
jgi:hypothetical protein